ncbi:Uncharacterized protein FWK35_00034588 [Aphis craccivora]|uniref:Uncharacterized protein n=1 Tax=Aphis craccivora TaxID=307492 RepID=A0A6G0VM07_APHCR|nr:Uncharacterized protein FWK35_00034588 [Aphis craccivora]
MDDSDSLVYEIRTSNFFDDIKRKLFSYFDTSNYPKNHNCYSDRRKNQPGYFKDELKSEILLEFITLRSLRPKLYAYKTDKDEVKKAKASQQLCKSMNCIQSKDNFVYSKSIDKIALSANDDKRIIMGDVGIMNKPRIIVVKPHIRSKPIIPNLLEIHFKNLRELYFILDKGCCILKHDNAKLYIDWQISRDMVVKILTDLI